MFKTSWQFSLSFLIFGMSFCSVATQARNRADTKIEQRIQSLISQMSLEEKVSLLGGTGFDTRPLPRLGIPSIRMTDGPIGVRNGRATAFPAGIAVGASFDPLLIHQMGIAMAEETRAIGRQMLLGPCVNISRHPFGGRNFESFGEDPYLSSKLAADYVRGVQSRNVLASVKHFALNEQEFERTTIDVQSDFRGMFEVHFPAYKAAIDAGVWTLMSSYNKVNGHWSTENDFLQNQVVKKMWKFQGFIVSDWDATHSSVKAAKAGLDLEMPYGTYFNETLAEAVRTGHLEEEIINDKVRRLLRAMFHIGMIDPSLAPQLPPPVGPESEEHQTLARHVAEESLVLLKNEANVLPLKKQSLKSIAVIGPNAATLRVNAGGSSKVEPFRQISPLRALREKAMQRGIKINYAVGQLLPGDQNAILTEYLSPSVTGDEQGLKAEYFPNRDLSGPPALTRIEPLVDLNTENLSESPFQTEFSVRWTGFLKPHRTGRFKLMTLSDDGVRLFLDNREIISNWSAHSGMVDLVDVDLVAGHSYALRIEYYQESLGALMKLGWQYESDEDLVRAVEIARNSDVAIVFTGLGNDMEGEGQDLPSMQLPKGQKELIKAVAAVNPNTIVVLNAGNPVAMDEWLGDVKGLVHAWYPGQEGGAAIANVLFGVVNPSGKLPVSLLKRWEDSPAYGNYPGVNGKVNYAEGIFIGYRWYDSHSIEPHFPFGFGLSYTQFSYSNLKITPVDSGTISPLFRVEFQVQNTGKVRGREVPQLYVGEVSPWLPRPVRELKGFEKIELQPGESKTVSMDLNSSAFAYFNDVTMGWAINPGAFNIEVGSSSRDLKLREQVRLH